MSRYGRSIYSTYISIRHTRSCILRNIVLTGENAYKFTVSVVCVDRSNECTKRFKSCARICDKLFQPLCPLPCLPFFLRVDILYNYFLFFFFFSFKESLFCIPSKFRSIFIRSRYHVKLSV